MYAKDKAIIITELLSHKDMIMCHLEYKKERNYFFFFFKCKILNKYEFPTSAI